MMANVHMIRYKQNDAYGNTFSKGHPHSHKYNFYDMGVRAVPSCTVTTQDHLGGTALKCLVGVYCNPMTIVCTCVSILVGLGMQLTGFKLSPPWLLRGGVELPSLVRCSFQGVGGVELPPTDL